MEALFVLLVTICQCFAVMRYGKYNTRRINVADIVSPLSEYKISARSLLDCSRQCLILEPCLSVLYTKEGKECRINTDIVLVNNLAVIPSLASHSILIALKQVGS